MVHRGREKIVARWSFSITFISLVLSISLSLCIPAMAQDPPVVVSITPAPGSAVRDPNFRASAIIRDKSGKGVDLSPTGSTIKLFYPSGSLVPGKQSDNGVDTIYWDLARPLPADGSADGLYTIVVTPKDRSGRWGDTVSVGFIYDTWVPVVRETSPANGEILRSPPSRFMATIDDGNGSGLDLLSISASVLDPGGNRIPARISYDGITKLVLSFDPQAVEGRYSVVISFQDRAGNRPTAPFSTSFFYSVTPPKLIRTIPTDGLSLRTMPSEIEAVLEDISGTGINFLSSAMKLLGPDGKEVEASISNDGKGKLLLLPRNPFPTDGKADGIYELRISAVDNAGNRSEYQVRFRYDTVPPTIASVVPAQGDVLRSLRDIVIEFRDDGSGMDFRRTSASLFDPRGREFRCLLTNNGLNTLRLIPSISPGSSPPEGRYKVGVVGADMAGNELHFEWNFLYSVTPPKVVSISPRADDFVRGPLLRISAKLQDFSGEGIDLSSCKIGLIGPNGIRIPGSYGNDGSETIFLDLSSPLPTDGKADGPYSIEIEAVDRAGNRSLADFGFIYDNLPPEVVGMEPPDGAILSKISSISFALEDKGGASGIDPSSISVRIVDPDGHELALERVSVGAGGRVEARFRPPSREGVYWVNAMFRDRAGNSPLSPFSGHFVLSPASPSASIVFPEDGSFLNSSPNRIVGVISAPEGEIVDLSLSTIRLVDPSGKDVEGTQEGDYEDGTARISWRPLRPLPSDGSGDGIYRVLIVPATRSGIRGATAVFTFIYDTRPPSLVEILPGDGGLVRYGIHGIALSAKDDLSGIDPDSLSVRVIGPSGKELSGRWEDRGGMAQGVMGWIFDPPLPGDGSADGIYRIELSIADRARNLLKASSSFLYDTIAPAIISVDPSDGSISRSRVSEVKAEIREAGSGIEPSSVSFLLYDSEGRGIPGTLSFGGDLISLSFQQPLVEGKYNGRISLKDRAGNALTSPFLFGFRVDMSPPQVLSTTPSDGAFVSGQISEILCVLRDDSGISLGPSGSLISLEGPLRSPDASGEVQEGEIYGKPDNDGTYKLILRLKQPLSADGMYRIHVIPVDIVGNRDREQIARFTYDTNPPQVISTSPSDGEIARSRMDMIVLMTSDLSGLAPPLVSIIDPDGKDVMAGIRIEGDAIRILIPPVEKEGTYKAYVTLADRAGNITERPFQISFTYAPSPPELISVSPSEGSFVSGPLWMVSATLRDRSGLGLDLDGSSIHLLGPKGAVQGKVERKGDTLVLHLNAQLPTDGSADGVYLIAVVPKDRSGNIGTEVVKGFLYDTSPPKIISTYPSDGEVLRDAPSQIVISASDGNGSGLDLLRCQGILRGPNGLEIPLSTMMDEMGKLILPLSSKSMAGRYDVVVSLTDRAGNRMSSSFSFVYAPKGPEVISIAPNDGAILGPEPFTVSVRIRDLSEEGIDLESSTIRCIGPDGKEVMGKLEVSGIDLLLWHADSPLPTDGSADGEYRIQVVPVDRTGLKGEMKEIKIVRDTIPPKPSSIELRGPGNVSSEILDGKGIPVLLDGRGGEIRVVAEDTGGSGVDPSKSGILLLDPNGAPVPGHLSHNGTDTLCLSFGPLKVSGRYELKVSIVDRAGNETIISSYPLSPLLLDPDPPKISILKPSDGERMESFPITIFGSSSDGQGSGVKVVEVMVRRGGGAKGHDEVTWVRATDKGEEMMWSSWEYRFVPEGNGIYEVEARAIDVAGNEARTHITIQVDATLRFMIKPYVWPNPVRGGEVHIRVELSVPAKARLRIFSASGRPLYDSGDLELEGRADMVWNCRDRDGRHVSSGIYFWMLEATDGRNRAVQRGRFAVLGR